MLFFCAHAAERPTFLRRPINQVVLEEETVEFRCQVQGDPQPNVRWRKDDIDVPRGRYVLLPEYSPNGSTLSNEMNISKQFKLHVCVCVCLSKCQLMC